jgi:putative ABC transport system substrate-binding protein
VVVTRRAFLGTLAGSLLAAPLAAEAQSAAKVARIGLLGDVPSFLDEAFRQGLRELGYIEGQNIVIEHRFPDWKYERLPGLAANLVRLNVDVIVAASPAATKAAKQATSTVPIVFTVSGDPVADGFVASLARPGGNITGLATIGPELVGKQLQMLKSVAPTVSRVAVLQNPNTHRDTHRVALRQAEDSARGLGVQLQFLEARTPSEIEAAFAAMSRQRVDGILVLRDAAFRAQRAQITALAAKHRLPAVYGLREEAEAGGLIAYGASVPHLYRRAATYVDKILKGAKPADLPVEQPAKFELVINLKTAKALGLTISASLLQRADQVIE